MSTNTKTMSNFQS